MATTLLLTRPTLETAIDIADLADQTRSAFTAHREEPDAQRVATPLGAVTAMVLVPGVADGVPAYTVKVHAKNPSGNPSIQGVICLHDLDTGHLLAVLDSPWLTALRTGVAAALGSDLLARQDARSVAVIGAGAQGRAQLSALSALRPIEQVRVFEADPGAAHRLAADMGSLGAVLGVAASPRAAVEAADIVLVATWPTSPVLHAGQLRPGTQVTSLGI